MSTRNLYRRHKKFLLKIKPLLWLRLYGRALKCITKHISRLNENIAGGFPLAEALALAEPDKLDAIIEKIARRKSRNFPSIPGKDLDDNGICVLASKIYDHGGHTELLIRLLDCYAGRARSFVEANTCDGSEKSLAEVKLGIIEKKGRVFVSPHYEDVFKHAATLYGKIFETKPKHIFVFTHPQDAVSAFLLAIITMNTSAVLYFVPHADHLLTLGLNFADVIPASRCLFTESRAHHARKFYEMPNIPAYDNAAGAGPLEIREKQRVLGLEDEDIVTLTGTTAYKIFSDPMLEYWTLIKRTLSAHGRVKHIFVASLSGPEKEKIADIFADAQALLRRVIFLEPIPDFSALIKLSDLYIDSFPMNGSLVCLDVMREGKPLLIKKNTFEPHKCFVDFFYPGYEHAYDNPDDMFTALLALLQSKPLREEAAQKIVAFYSAAYSREKIQGRLEELLRIGSGKMPVNLAAGVV